MIGTVLNERWRIVAPLGRGGMGEVFLAEHLTLGRKEALKILMPAAARDPEFVSRFRREARAINRLRHPNIITVYDFGQLPDGRFFLSMEYAEGDSLYQALRKRKRFTVASALHVLGQLAYAVHHAHSRGVLHRDIKPGNLILVGPDESLKVLDFGMAKIVATDQAETAAWSNGNVIWGTPKYMAPERVNGRESEPRTDLYSIGCLGYELLVGTPPFDGNPSDVLRAHLDDAPEPPSARRPEAGIPPELDAVILRCLEKNPIGRFATAADLYAALRRVPGYPQPKVEARRHFVPTVETPDSLAVPRTSSDAYGNLRGALRQVAEKLLDFGLDDARLVSGVACLRDNERALTRLEAAQDALEHEAAALRETVTDREVSLRFAIGELRFAARQADEDTLKIRELETRLDAVVAEGDRLGAIKLGLESISKARAEGLTKLKEAYVELEAIVDELLPRFEKDPGMEVLAGRLATVRSRRPAP